MTDPASLLTAALRAHRPASVAQTAAGMEFLCRCGVGGWLSTTEHAAHQAEQVARTLGTVREEWVVTGEPGRPYPSYRFTFGSPLRLSLGKDADPEAEARRCATVITPWAEGPFLHRRTITESPWTEVPL